MKWAYSILFWIPFAFAVFLSVVILEHPNTGSPAFYSFLPMTFFFTGFAFMELVRRIRNLENRLRMLEGDENAGAQPTPDSAGSSRHNPTANSDSEMFGLFHDPVAWSGSVVRTWLRFGLFVLFFALLIAFMIYQASHFGWRGAWGLGIFLGMFQLQMLYALRRLFLKSSPQG
jgi:hypothetical protein